MSVEEYLNELKDHNLINSWVKKGDYIILYYSLSTVKETGRCIEYNEDIKSFMYNMAKSAFLLEEDIMNSLTDDMDFFGYNTYKELKERITEETNRLMEMVIWKEL